MRFRRPAGREDRDLLGVFVYAAAFAVASVMTYLFNAMIGRRLDAQDFSTFVALLGVLLALTGASTALFGGGAMSAARIGDVPRMPWRGGLMVVGAISIAIGLAPFSADVRAAGWFGLAAVLLMMVAWTRGLLIGFGRLGFAGGTMVVEGAARVAFALIFVSLGFRVVGATAGLAFGVAVGLLLTLLALPRRGGAAAPPVSPEVWASIAGLFFLGVVQYVDVVAVRMTAGLHIGDYAAASSLARIAMYAQLPAAAYAIRRTAIVGPRAALNRVVPLALGPAVAAVVLLEALPGRLLSVTYGGHYVHAVALLRVLTIAMALAGASTVAISVMLGAGRTAWVYSETLVALVGSVLVFLVAANAPETAIVMAAVQGGVFVVAAVHAHRLIRASRSAQGGFLFFNWRDTLHPQGGGSEVFVEEVARRMAAAGRRVTIFCAEHPNAPRDEVRDGVRFVRRGTWRTVYLWAALYHLLGRFGPHDVVVDVQNAVPFFTPLYCGRPVVVLVHHVHREQWAMLFGPRVSRIGWWVESRVAPVVYRRAAYVAVSDATRADLVTLGVDTARISVVHNGRPDVIADHDPTPKAASPTVTYLGRLVPHKRVEVLMRAAADLHDEFPGLRALVVGHGMWEPKLRRAAAEMGVEHLLTFEGFVDDDRKRRILGESWVLALPSVKEGWGLAVIEAAVERTPTVAFRVGGLIESIVDGETGLLADDYEGFLDALRTLLASPDTRSRMADAARERALSFSWDATATAFAALLDRAAAEVQVPLRLSPTVESA